jgi:GMC oxidoreductase
MCRWPRGCPLAASGFRRVFRRTSGRGEHANKTTRMNPNSRMGRPDDPGAVVDPHGRLIGLPGLRVVDASIMPCVPGANTNRPAIVLAEKTADLDQEYEGRRCSMMATLEITGAPDTIRTCDLCLRRASSLILSIFLQLFQSIARDHGRQSANLLNFIGPYRSLNSYLFRAPRDARACVANLEAPDQPAGGTTHSQPP